MLNRYSLILTHNMRILIAETLAPAAVKLLQQQPGWEVIVSNPKEYMQHLAGADALIVRSAVTVDKAVLAAAPNLRVIGRAGVGVDNVDLPSATAAGVLVMNTPGGNAVSVAEHTMALMLSLARSIPNASASVKSGKWEKRKFMGTELRAKTLGVIGLGSIGREVVKRAAAFEMRVIAHDPYVHSQTAKECRRGTGGSAGAVRRKRLHHAAHRAYARIRPAALARRLRHHEKGRADRELRARRADRSRSVAGSAGVGSLGWRRAGCFREEPPSPTDPLLAIEALVATPHIGGSTEEAQETVGVRIAQQIVEYLQNGAALHAVNLPALTPEQYKTLAPYGQLAERLGSFASYIATGNPKTIRLVYFGKDRGVQHTSGAQCRVGRSAAAIAGA